MSQGQAPTPPVNTDWPLQRWLDWQERQHPRTIELGLERTRTVALRLGLLPARCITVTIAGTNGKGSSATLAAAIYRAAGYRCGCYTSPHLLRYNERVALDGEAVGDAALCRAFSAIEAARGEVPLTYFEYGTLAALWLFREAQVQIQVLEVGLGGRLDAVNIVDADAALLTNVGLDHMDWLGPDRESIGREKAGIFRSGRPAVCVDADPPATVLQAAAALRIDLQRVGIDFDGHAQAQAQRWCWQGRGRRYEDLPLPALPGAVQLRNAAGVLAVIEALQGRAAVAPAAIAAGLQTLRLPGRLQRHGDLLLDVGHNAEAAAVLAAHLRTHPVRALVLGMLADKPVEAVGRQLAAEVPRVYAAGLPPPRGLTGAELSARLAAAGVDAAAFDDVAAAIRAARRLAGDRPIAVCGSFLTVAAALSTDEARNE